MGVDPFRHIIGLEIYSESASQQTTRSARTCSTLIFGQGGKERRGTNHHDQQDHRQHQPSKSRMHGYEQTIQALDNAFVGQTKQGLDQSRLLALKVFVRLSAGVTRIRERVCPIYLRDRINRLRATILNGIPVSRHRTVSFPLHCRRSIERDAMRTNVPFFFSLFC